MYETTNRVIEMANTKPVRMRIDQVKEIEALAIRLSIKEERICDKSETLKRVIEEGIAVLEKYAKEKPKKK